jgi:hypothetical protein
VQEGGVSEKPGKLVPIRQVEANHQNRTQNFEHLPLGSGKVLEANVGTFAEADFPPESVESRDEILQRISH